MVLCAHLFAVTTTLRLTPFVLKLPVRPPVLVAKQASSLAFLSDNRLGLGVGISPWPEDFATSASTGTSAASGWTSAWTSSAA